MNASILTIGDELLIGSTVDTNSAWMAATLNPQGIDIAKILTVSDGKTDIQNGLDILKPVSDIILITGGLGPTNDDLTKNTLADYFNADLVKNETIHQKISEYFARKGKAQVAFNEDLAMVPKNASIIPNDKGTACGMWFVEDGTVFVSMPGVPHEMKHMVANYVLPKMVEHFNLSEINHQYIMTAGIGESDIAMRIKAIENNLPKSIKLAYLPSLGSVKLRLSSKTENKDKLLSIAKQIGEIIPTHVYSYNEEKLEECIGKLLTEKKVTISTAESCTGGYIGYHIVKIPGCSAYYEGSIASYSYEIKTRLLGVKQSTLDTYGAVSQECVTEMLTGLLNVMNTDYGIAVSGIAGPGGATPDKPVGTVWMAVGSKDNMVVKKYELYKDRLVNIKVTSVLALNMLRRIILGISTD